jgi:hypothetical protein
MGLHTLIEDLVPIPFNPELSAFRSGQEEYDHPQQYCQTELKFFGFEQPFQPHDARLENR